MGYMEKWIRAALVCAVLPVLVACASGHRYSDMQNTIAPVAADSGRIYFYRPMNLYGDGFEPDVKVDGNVVGSALTLGFFYVDLPAGDHKISSDTEAEYDLSVTLAAGQTRYVLLKFSAGLLFNHIVPALMDDEKAVKGIADCVYTGWKWPRGSK